MKKITEQEYSEYEKILKKYQQLRNKIKRMNKVMKERSGLGMRGIQSVELQRERKISLSRFRLTGRRIFKAKMKQLMKVVEGGEKAYFDEYKRTYLKLFRDYLFEDNPESFNGLRYSAMQIKEAYASDKKLGKLMELYNFMFGLNSKVLVYMIKTQRIPEFKYFYNEFSRAGLKVQEQFTDDIDKAMEMIRKNPNLKADIMNNIAFGKDYGKQATIETNKLRRGNLNVKKASDLINSLGKK